MNNRNEEPCAVLKDSTCHNIALQGISIHGRLTETLASIQVEQRYRNPHQHNVEAAYTFPLPMGAVLLAMEADIADQKLAGQVIEKKVAEQRYEEAITDGDSAVMVQALGNGLYSMNVGNLLAGETAVIRYRYALTISWLGDQLRLTIPTTTAPRYGDAAVSGLEPWQVPGSSLTVEYPFDLTVSIEGKLADAQISSPTHPVGMARTERGLDVTLIRHATLDRDFVLTAKTKEGLENTCLLVKDGEQHVALASLRIPPVTDTSRSPLCVKIVIDCSGSMAGVSIAQARKAALVMLDLLKPEDTFNITLFGNHHEHLFDRMVPAEARFVDRARARLNCLAADFGGTETGKAMAAAYKLRSSATGGFLDRISAKHVPDKLSQPTVLLITDGEIWNYENVIDLAAKSGHRVFTVGVGLSVADGFVTTLAKATGAACELVSPQEGMADKVLAQFHRLQQPLFGQAQLVWDVCPSWQTPLPAVLFAGDTIQVYAGFESGAPGSVRLHMPNSSVGDSLVATVVVPVELPDIPRLAAEARIGLSDDETEQIRLAVSYQLLTERTSFLVVAERLEKADDLPILHKVPQMVAAGWGGTGVDYCASLPTSLQMDMSLEVPAVLRKSSRSVSEALVSSGVDRYDIPAFLRQGSELASETPSPGTSATIISLTPLAFIESLNDALANLLHVQAMPSTLDELKNYGLPTDIMDALAAQVASAWPEKSVVLAFLYALSECALANHLQRGLKRLIVSSWKRQASDLRLYQWCMDCLSRVEGGAWNWSECVAPETINVISAG